MFIKLKIILITFLKIIETKLGFLVLVFALRIKSIQPKNSSKNLSKLMNKSC